MSHLINWWSSPPTQHGSARLVSAAQAGLTRVKRPNSLTLPLGTYGCGGKLYGIPITPTGQHMLVLGPTRSGKTSRIYLPFLLTIADRPEDRQQPTLVISDPKHELLGLAGPRLRAAGYQIHVVAPDQPTLSDQWNPLSSLHDDRGQLDHSALWSLIDALVPKAHEADPYWIDNARLLLFGSCVAVGHAYGSQASLSQALAWSFRPADTLAYLQSRDPHVAFLLAGLLENVKENPRLLGTILSELPGKLAVWMAPQILALYQNAGWDWSSVLAGGLHAIFLSATPEQSPMAQLFWRQALNALHHAQQRTGHLTRPALLLLDELGNLGPIPQFSRAVTTLAGARVSIVAGLQSVAQLQSIYGPAESEVLLSNLPLRIVLPGLDSASGQWMSAHVGMGTQMVSQPHSSSDGRSSYSTSYVSRPVLTSDEISRLDAHALLVQLLGNSSTILRQRPYYRVRAWQAIAKLGHPRDGNIGSALDPWRHALGTPPDLEALAKPLQHSTPTAHDTVKKEALLALRKPHQDPERR